MAATFIVERACSDGRLCEIAFAGDNVRLAGQIDYPGQPAPIGHGYPLLFTLHHAGWRSREDYDAYARLALRNGYAVFRWDKRGTGRSGGSGRGSTTQDSVLAYENALEQPGIDPERVLILAQSEASKLLGSSFGLFARVQRPAGVILVSNMLNEQEIQAIDAPVFIVQGDQDWHSPAHYALAASARHAEVYGAASGCYVAEGAGRSMTTDGQTVHRGALDSIERWIVNR